MLNAHDIIEGAKVSNRTNFYVLGCYDKRITFYSQQVRALSLVYALHELGFLKNDPRIAVIGAGAAGLTVAAAIAAQGRVVLFETARELLPLQSGATRRKLDPHIYDWPSAYAADPIANLPILDWEAGPARIVRGDVVVEFEDIAARMGGRLEKRTGHQVKQIRPVDKTYEVVYDRLDNAPGGGPQQDLSDRFDMIFLAIGYGLEPNETIPGLNNTSYWSDAGVPSPEFAARPSPRFFISGNGDGGLIDLVAAASRDFDHSAMIRLITAHPGIGEITNDLVQIDIRARNALAGGMPFNIYDTYEAEIRDRIEENGLVREVVRRLRPGIQLTLQTDRIEVFNVNTSILNRIAAFATIKACQNTDQCSFTHVPRQNVTRVNPVEGAADQPTYILDCDGVRVEADEVIIRRGPKRGEIRQPFLDILDDYENTHDRWLERHANDTIIPVLSPGARAFFQNRAQVQEIPLSRRLGRQAIQNLPITFQLRANGNDILWSGALSKENISEPWDNNRTYEVILPDSPEALGHVAGAILRLACHARHVTLYAEPARWNDYARRLSINSQHAAGMSAPRILAEQVGGAAQNQQSILATRLSRQLHSIFDTWILNHLHQHLEEFLRTGNDPAHQIGLIIAPEIRQMMTETWREWHVAFEDDTNLLNRYLRLMVCAIEDDDDPDVAQVLVGPNKLKSIILGTAVSLAIASSWRATVPKNIGPGNLRRQQIGAPEESGHICAADMLNSKKMSMLAGSYMWQTNFVILTVEGLIELAERAEKPFAETDSQQPSFTETIGSGPVLMWISPEFSNALERGVAALATMLADTAARHLTPLTNAIQKVEEEV